MSKSNPTWAMCVKVVVNNGPYASVDFEQLDMPTTPNGEVDDTCLTLEHSDDPKALAQFFEMEWERLYKANRSICR